MNQKGFTLGEIVIVIGIIAILAALIAPLAVNQINQKRLDACRNELKILKKAIVGDPDLIESGTRSSFGFVGDLGTVPQTLDELLNQGALPAWQLSSGIWWGWRGPYLSEYKDPWGNNYNYTNFLSVPGTLIIARIWSRGPNGLDEAGSGDDMVIEIRTDEAYSMVGGNTSDPCGAAAGFTDITIFYPTGAAVTSVIVSTDSTNPIYNPTVMIPIGIRRLQVSAPAMQLFIYINNGPFTTVNLRQPGPCS